MTSKDSELTTTVYALRNRRLVTTRRVPRQGWIAELTERGQQLLDHGYLPAPPTSPPRRRAGAPAANNTPAVTVDELLTQLAAGNGRITVAEPSEELRAAWRRAVAATRRGGHLTGDQCLTLTGRDTGDLVIELVQAKMPRREARHQRRLPEAEADHLHPVAGEATPAVAESSTDRARRVIDTVVVALEAEGFTSKWDGQLVVRRGTFGQRVALGEEDDAVDAFPDSEALDTMYEWQRLPATRTTVPSGRLTLELADERYQFSGRRRRWADRRRWRLEDKLGEVVDEVVDRATSHDAREAETAAQAAERMRQWQEAMTAARHRHVEARRLAVLRGELARWREANDVRRYCDELDKAAAAADAKWADGAGAWVSWARGHADRIDPLRGHPELPEVPDPTPEDLRPFLGGWSPYGPDARG